MTYRFISTPMPPDRLDQPALWFIYQGFQLLVINGVEKAEVPRLISPAEIGLTLDRQEYLGYLAGDEEIIHCFSGEVGTGINPPAGMSFGNLRALFPLLAEIDFWLAGRAVQIVDWDRTHQFCSRCGHKTADQIQDRSKLCPNCGFSSYPRLAPAIIVRVTKNTQGQQQILLARAQRFPPGLFSVLAGFVEPGETLEECVAREIYEEVGLTVKDIRYFGSQPWPFPHSLMIAFTAEYEAGEIKTDPVEIIEAGWYSPDRMPTTALPPSIANRLIVTWLEQVKFPPAPPE
jgi:NAD+ diphosphatase